MPHDLNGTFNSQGYNLIGKSDGTDGFTNGVNGDQVGTPVDPKLGILTDNAGPTKTHALLVGSPTIDAGNSALLNDQRGQPRPVDDQTVVNAAGGNASDIGAYEAHSFEVNSTADTDDGLCRALGTGNGCTLREAINAANGESGGKLIVFAAALTSGGPAAIALSTVLPNLSSDMTISGPGASLLTVQRSIAGGTPRFRIFTNSGPVTANISGLTISNGHTADGTAGGNGDNGGAIFNVFGSTLNLMSVVISGNVTGDGDISGGLGGYGGAIFNNGTVTLIDSSVNGNSTGSGPAAVGGSGGGIFNTGTLTIRNSSISDNLTGTGLGGSGSGGGVSSDVTLTIIGSTISGNSTGAGVGSGGGGIWAANTLTIANSTISGNQANGFGGGLAAFFGSTTLTNVTITNNRGGNLGGGGLYRDSGAVTLRNTLVAGNYKGASPSTTADDIVGTMDPISSFNLIGTGGSGGLTNDTNNNQIGVSDPKLATLSNNGGPTQTHGLLPGSPAIDAGSNANLPSDTFDLDGDGNTSEPVPFDQRGPGFSRASDGNGDGISTVDIGAFEVQSILVTNTADSGAGSLRQAITDANTNAVPEAINFQTGLTGTIVLSTALPDISSSMAISGSEPSELTIQRSFVGGTPAFRIFTINAGSTVVISGLTITNGLTPVNANGGGILNAGTLTLRRVRLSANRTSDGTSTGAAGSGGGIYSSGTVAMTDSSISANRTGAGVDDNAGGYGGGVYNASIMTLTNSDVTANQTGGGDGAAPAAGAGGGIANIGTLTLTHSTVISNETPLEQRVGEGGGIQNVGTLLLTDSIVANNKTGGSSGGGIDSADGTVTLINCLISGNEANGPGGGISSFDTVNIVNSSIINNLSGTGGGLAICCNQVLATVVNSTISGNRSTGIGGGIWIVGLVALTNLTVTDNRSDSNNSGGEQAGGIYAEGTVTLNGSIVANNFRGPNPSIFADDIKGALQSPSSYNLIGIGGSGGINNGVNNNQVGIADPRLGPLTSNGGPTQTHALLAGSPALDAGNNALVASPPFSGPPFTDQRGAGFARIVDGPDADNTDTVDIGAYEAQVSVADIADQAINEDGSLSLPFNVGGAASITSVTATSSNTTLVPNNPANISISGSGSSRTLHISPVANASGTSTITVTVNGSNSQAMADTLLLIVNPVNDAPSFTKGPDQTVNENSGAQTINNWASNISAGPANEAGQSVSFMVTNNSNAALFAVGPAISSTGTLTYTPAAGVSGTAVITIALKDNGGTANGGQDTSATQTFNIIVREGGTLALSVATYSVAENGGTAAITITRSGGSAGTATVHFATSDGTATAADYTSVSQTVTFNDGEVSKSVNVAITDDLFKETDETVNLALSTAGGSGQLGPQTSAVLTIVDNDPLGGYLHFSAFNNNTTESSGVTPIGVERLGTTTQAVTVNYATSEDNSTAPCSTANSIASSRCDFTTAMGTLHFAPGETSKVILVLISQDNFVEGPETLTLTLSDVTGGAELATPSTVPLTIADDATEPATNPIDSADAFVRQHYHDFLNREPDAAGLAFWSNQITECEQPGATCSAEIRRINVSAAFFLSIEFQETGYLAYRFYKSAYGDINGTPVPLRFVSEFLPDTQQIGKDVVIGQPGAEQQLENNKVAYALDFVSRSRFTSAYPNTLTPAEFVDALFANGSVIPSATDRNAAINEFGGAGNTADVAARARALRRVAENSTLKQQETNKAFVLMQYFGYLRRNPNDPPEANLDFGGYNFWLGKLNEFNGNFVNAEMVKAFIVSGEYRHRFGP